MSAVRLLTCVMLVCATQVALGQTSCVCMDPENIWLTDSTAAPLPLFGGYSYEGLTGKESRALEKCLERPIGPELMLDHIFRKKLCACQPVRVCLSYLEFAKSKKGQPPVLYFYFVQR